MGLRSWYRQRRVRNALETLKRYSGYAGAEPSRLDNWAFASQAVNVLIHGANPRLRSRVRDLVRNFPPFGRAVTGYTAYVLGQGARFQSMAILPDGAPNHAARRMIEMRFRAWMESDADISRHLHWYEMQRLMCRQMLECGEAFFVKAYRGPGERWRINPFCLLPVEADRLTDLTLYQAKRDDVQMFSGVEYRADTGEVLAYHVADDGYAGRVSRVDARDMLHIFQTLRPGQLRGVTPLAPAILFARALADYSQSELDAAKMQSKYIAFVTSEDPRLAQAARGIRVPGASGASERPVPSERLENGIIEWLRTGESVQFAAPPARPSDAYERFTRSVHRMVSITCDVPYEVISGDYTGVNYSTLKASRVDAQMLLVPHKQLVEHQHIAQVLLAWMDCDALTRPDLYPGYWHNPELYRAGLWIHGGLPSVDPLRDGNADVLAVSNGFRSPQQVIMSAGGDPDEVIRQRQEWARKLAEAGLAPASDTPLPSPRNNPAYIGAAETPENKAEDIHKNEAPVQANPNDAVSSVENSAEVSLNGAQVSSMVEVITKVALGELPRDSGIAILKAAFSLTEVQAEEIMGSVGKGFTPTVKEEGANDNV